VNGCGHPADPRRVCDVCDAGAAPFLACSRACLDTHLGQAHAGEPGDARARALRYLGRVNANVTGDRETFAGHRARLMGLLEAAARGGSLCVLGAGNGSDLDVPALARVFDEIHLVDLDGEALARCAAALPSKVRDQVTAHAGVDLTGFLDRLDDWGDDFPATHHLGQAAVAAIQGILGRLGRRFDAVVSTCALSQLAVPYHRAWVLPASAWAQFHDATTAVHLSTLAGAVEPGGAGVLVFDVLTSRKLPELRALEGADQEALDAFLDERASDVTAAADPDPEALLRRLRSPGLERLVESPRLTRPWLWNIGAESQLVYGLLFRRP